MLGMHRAAAAANGNGPSATRRPLPTPRYWKQARAENPLARFVPFSSLVAEHDVITRGGDYLRVWRLDGVPFECADEHLIADRHEALCSLLRNLAGGQWAVWTHRLHRVVSDELQHPHDKGFARDLSVTYQAKLAKHRMMSNELYLTLVYQRQLQGLMETLTRTTAAATGQATGQVPTGALLGGPPIGGVVPAGTPIGAAAAGAGLFGGQLQGSATPRVAASMLGNRSLTLPKGTAFTCALKTKVISAVSGLVGCQVQRNVFSDDGRVLLIERGSHLDGEYRIASVRPGTVRIPVLWTRIRTPNGVTVDIDSPGTGQLGESGIEGYVDNRWGERIGAAMLLSLIDDSVKLVIQNQASDTQADTIVLPSTTANTSKLAEKVLESTINIPPLIYQNQGGIVGIYVARDVDFSSVYELKPVQQ